MVATKEYLENKLATIREEHKETITTAIEVGALGVGMVAGGFLKGKGWGLGGYSADKIAAGVGLAAGLAMRNKSMVMGGMGLLAPTLVGVGDTIAKKGLSGITASSGVDDNAGAASNVHQLHAARDVSPTHGANIVHELQKVR